MGRTVNRDLLDESLKKTEIYQIYAEKRNSYGWTAEDLRQEGETAVIEFRKTFWKRDMTAILKADGTVDGY